MAGRDTDSPALPHFIDGERVAGESNRFGDVYDPATRRPGDPAGPGAGAVRHRGGERRGQLQRAPALVGVCAGITPFNTAA